MTRSTPPNLRVETIGETRGAGPWGITFVIANEGVEDVTLVEARMPHVVLRADPQDLSATPALAPGASVRLEFTTTFQAREDASEPANPFLILLLRRRDEDWRLLVQLALRADGTRPLVDVARVTAQRVGFSGSPT